MMTSSVAAPHARDDVISGWPPMPEVAVTITHSSVHLSKTAGCCMRTCKCVPFSAQVLKGPSVLCLLIPFPMKACVSSKVLVSRCGGVLRGPSVLCMLVPFPLQVCPPPLTSTN